MKSHSLDGLLEEMRGMIAKTEQERLATLYALSSVDVSKLSKSDEILYCEMLCANLPKPEPFEMSYQEFPESVIGYSSATIDAVWDHAFKKLDEELVLSPEDIAKYYDKREE